MNFYVISDSTGVIGCECGTLKEAIASIDPNCNGTYSIDLVRCQVSADTIRRLLGYIGGYAIETKEVYRATYPLTKES